MILDDNGIDLSLMDVSHIKMWSVFSFYQKMVLVTIIWIRSEKTFTIMVRLRIFCSIQIEFRTICDPKNTHINYICILSNPNFLLVYMNILEQFINYLIID
jgi:hypothetical protein